MKANVVIFSYNRPRMLREAIISVLWNSTHKNVDCWVVDDGSDFDVLSLLDEFEDDRLIVVKGKKPTLEERVNDSSRFANNVNSVIEGFEENEFVVYLCDDDVLGHKFLSYTSLAFENTPHLHYVSGDPYYFYDGENPYEKGRHGFKAHQKIIEMVKSRRDDVFFWHVGNFAHRTECNLHEGLRWRSKEWGDKSAHSWDVDYITDLNRLHATHVNLKIPALYRREHANMLSHRLGRLTGDPMSEDSVYGLTPQELDTSMVEGLME